MSKGAASRGVQPRTGRTEVEIRIQFVEQVIRNTYLHYQRVKTEHEMAQDPQTRADSKKAMRETAQLWKDLKEELVALQELLARTESDCFSCDAVSCGMRQKGAQRTLLLAQELKMRQAIELQGTKMLNDLHFQIEDLDYSMMQRTHWATWN